MMYFQKPPAFQILTFEWYFFLTTLPLPGEIYGSTTKWRMGERVNVIELIEAWTLKKTIFAASYIPLFRS